MFKLCNRYQTPELRDLCCVKEVDFRRAMYACVC
jgi:hypothetical protein